MENIKLTTIEAGNLLAIDKAKIDFQQGEIFVASGGNGAGKTTLGKTLSDILAGKSPEKPLKEGENAGFYRVALETGHEIYWQFYEDSQLLVIRDEDGKTLSETRKKQFIKALAGEVKKPFDMDAFLRETQPKKQREMIQSICPVDLSTTEDELKACREERTEANRAVRIQEARVQPFDKELAEAQPIDQRALFEQLNAMRRHNSDIEGAKSELKNRQSNLRRIAHEISELEAKLQRLRKEKSDAITEVEESEKWLSENNKPYSADEMNAIQTQIDDAEQRNEAIRKAKEAAKEAGALQIAKEAAEAAQKAVERAEEKHLEVIRSADLPGGLQFDPEGDGLTLNGHPLSQASAAELTIAGLQIKVRELGPLRFIAFDGSHLDYDNTQKVLQWIRDNDLQAMVEIAERRKDHSALQLTVAEKYYE